MNQPAGEQSSSMHQPAGDARVNENPIGAEEKRTGVRGSAPRAMLFIVKSPHNQFVLVPGWKMSSLPARATVANTHGIRLPDEILLWDILLRLPCEDLIRCRAVSRAWRRAASAGDLLLEHHRRQPSLPLINRRGGPDAPRWSNVAALDHRAAQRLQTVARHNRSHVCVKASCDGLLLLDEKRFSRPLDIRVSICNPATRQIGHVPQLKDYDVQGLYRHRPTGEYRLLLRSLSNVERKPMCVLALDRHELLPRRIQCPLDGSSYLLSSSAPVLLHGNLHWAWHTTGLTLQTESKTILVFDTAAESFRQICSPVVPMYKADLFDMDGVLGLSSSDTGIRDVRIWVMQDYQSQVWSFKCTVKLPVLEMPRMHRSLMVVYEEGGVRLLVAWGGLLFCVDAQGKLLASFRHNGRKLSISKHFLKPSLVSHHFFSKLQGDMNAWRFI